MKSIKIFLLAAVLALSACAAPSVAADPAANGRATGPTGSAAARVLTIYAAASLTDAFTEIARSFEAAQPGVTVSLSFAGSQTLRAQIEQGAQADVFASANSAEMDALVASGYMDAAAPQIFLTNRLVVILPAANPAGLARLEDLAQSGLKLVIAAPEVPVGRYSLQVLENLEQSFGTDYQEKVLANVVSYENDVKHVVTKIQLGEADAGIVYASDSAAAPELLKIDIPAAQNVVARYPIAALAQAKNPDLAAAFTAYARSAAGQAILQRWGFSPVQ